MAAQPDPKPRARVRDPQLLSRLHREWDECAICGTSREKLSLHHIHKHPRDDVRANLVKLCGDGVQGCHGQIELGNHETKRSLCIYIANERRDTFLYLQEKLGGREQAIEWLKVNLLGT